MRTIARMRNQHPAIIEVGRLIRVRREAMLLSQEDFAAEIGLDRSYYSHIERGRFNMTLVVLFRIAAGLQCPPASLMPDVLMLVDLPPPMRSRGGKKRGTV
jgi:transcriptional regulator with XRE-family HTH domain